MKSPSPRPVFALLLLLLALAPARPASAQKSFSGTSDVVVVEVPVTVTRDGQPVRGLSAENFEVLDGRRKQDIVGFDVVDLSLSQPAAAGTAGRALPAAGRRHFLFLFDLSFSNPTAVARAREAALEVAREGLHPADLAAVATYSILQGPRLVLGFTPDREQLALAMETLGSPKLAKDSRDPLGLVFAELQAFSSGVGTLEGPSGDRAEREEIVREFLEDAAQAFYAVDRAEQQNRVTSMTRQMADLAKLMDTVQGRKYVVYLSEGFDDSLLVGAGGNARLGAGGSTAGLADSAIGAGGTPTGTASDSIASGESYNVNSDLMYGSGQVQNDLQAMLQEFKKANCTIQAVDIGGLRAGGGVAVAASGQNVLSQMASETGGQVFRNFNDLGAALDQMLEKTSVTYLLAIQPDKLERDGKYHRLRVRLKDVPRGTEVYHRPGFYAPLPFDKQQGLQRQLATAEALMGEGGGALAAAVLATPIQADPGKAYVPLMVEIEGEPLIAGHSGDVLPVEIYAYALDNDGAVHDFFAQTLPIDLQQAGAQLRQSGLKYFGHLDLDPGAYTVRVLVRNLSTGLSNLSILPLAVPDFASGAPALSPPLFPEPMGKWVMVTEAQERRRQVAYPFMLGEQPFIPAAAPTLSRQGEVQLPLLAHNLGEGDLSVSCRLRATDGTEVPGAKVDRVERMATASPGVSALVVHLSHSGLNPGSYTLEVAVSGPDGGAPLTATAAVRVAGRS